MTKFLIIVISVLLAMLVVTLLAMRLQSKFYKQKLKEKDKEFLYRWNETQQKQQEILNNAKKQKENLHNGDNSSNFNSSLGVLQKRSTKGNARAKNNSD